MVTIDQNHILWVTRVKNPFFTQSDIAKKVKKDKVRISGFLEAIVEHDDLSMGVRYETGKCGLFKL